MYGDCWAIIIDIILGCNYNPGARLTRPIFFRLPFDQFHNMYHLNPYHVGIEAI
jgi:hypothetical protein